MARVLVNASVWADTVNLTGALNGVALEALRELLDETTFADTSRKRAPGLVTGRLQLEGLALASTLDEVPPDSIGRSGGRIISVASSPTEGAVAYTMQADAAQFTEGGAIGELHTYSLSAEVNGPLVRGVVLARRNTGASNDFSSAINVGAVAAGQHLYAALHVLSGTGGNPLTTIAVQSDAADTFGSPTAQITFAQSSDEDAQWATPVAGPITDTWYRIGWTHGGSTTDIDVVVVIGIL